MLAPLAASLLRYGACALPITLERCLFSKITTTRWSGRPDAAFDFLCLGRRTVGAGFCGTGRRAAVLGSLCWGRAVTLGFFGAGGATGWVSCGVAETTVGRLLDGSGTVVDDESGTLHAADASSITPAIAKLVRCGDPRT
jgi:hypothetical protein